MMMKMTSATCALAFGAALLLPNLTQAQAEKSSQAKLAERIAEIRTETTRTRNQLQSTVDALNALKKQKSGDLTPTYNAYAAEVKNTHAAADWTGSRVGSMQSASKDYFGGWQTEVAGIANESLRKKAQRRLEAVRRSYDKVINSLKEASEEFKPFLSNLDDVQKTLANDITPGGVKSVGGTVTDANTNMKRVRSSVSEAISELGSMEKALSPKTSG